MATQQALRQALELSASNFRPKNADQWVEDMAVSWIRHPAIAGASDRDLERAIIDHMGSGQFAPKLADILALLRGGSGRPAENAGPTCLECGGSGWAEGSALLTDGSIDGPWALVCGCRPIKGVKWQDWRRWAEKRSDVQKFWITGQNLRQLPDEARLTAEQISRRADMKAGKILEFRRNPGDEHASDRRKAEKELKREGWR